MSSRFAGWLLTDFRIDYLPGFTMMKGLPSNPAQVLAAWWVLAAALILSLTDVSAALVFPPVKPADGTSGIGEWIYHKQRPDR